MDAFARRAPARPTPRRWRWPRLVLAGGLGLGLAVAACAMPAEYPMSLGRGLRITLDTERWAELDVDALAERIDEVSGAERVELQVSHSIEQRVDDEGREQIEEQVHLQMFVLGEGLDTESLWQQIEGDFPELAGAETHDVPLSGTVHGTLGGALSHRLLDVTIDQHGVEEAERRIMAELVAQGIAPEHASVDIDDSTDAQGRRRIEVRVEAERP